MEKTLKAYTAVSICVVNFSADVIKTSGGDDKFYGEPDWWEGLL